MGRGTSRESDAVGGRLHRPADREDAALARLAGHVYRVHRIAGHLVDLEVEMVGRNHRAKALGHGPERDDNRARGLAAHLVGSGSLVELLRARKHVVEQQ